MDNHPHCSPAAPADDYTENMFPSRTAQEFKTRHKIRILTRTLKPVPFRPAGKALDFARHETLLRRIGLWEFAHVEFDRSNIRVDLLAQLIASYAPSLRCGYVNGVRVLANRAQLGRALRLPPLEKKGEALEGGGVLEGLDFDESVEFVEEFVRNWMVLRDDHDDDGGACDMMMMGLPGEVLEGMRLIREGCLEKVDWDGLVWSMVEREMRDPGLVKCYYASHLQLLIRVQREELLREVPVVVVEDEEEDGGRGDVRMIGGVDELEGHGTELSLGNGDFGKVELQREVVEGEKRMDFDQEYKEEAVFNLENGVDVLFLRQFHVIMNGLGYAEDNDEQGEEGQEPGGDDDDDDVNEEEEEEEEDKHEDIPLEGMSSGNEDRHHAMLADTLEVEMPSRTVIDLNDDSLGDFIPSRDDPQMISGPSFFGNGHTHKRDIGQDYHDTHHSLNGLNKRLRLDKPRNAEPVDFGICMDQIQHWMGKARLMHATKVQSYEESTVNEQLLLNEIQNRNNMIEHLNKELLDEKHKGETKVYRLEKELYMMAKLVEGYREAMRETQKAFDEYRARCPQADEPFYKDVPGSKGLVLSVVELEKEQLKQREEERMKRLAFEKHLRDFEGSWMGKLEVQLSRIQSLGNRLMSVEDQVKLLNERKVKVNHVFRSP